MFTMRVGPTHPGQGLWRRWFLSTIEDQEVLQPFREREADEDGAAAT
jgi:hypothetical protein